MTAEEEEDDKAFIAAFHGWWATYYKKNGMKKQPNRTEMFRIGFHLGLAKGRKKP